MIGLEGAVEMLRAGIAARLPDKLDELEERLDLEPGALPPPKLVVGYELPLVGLEDWPTVMVVGLRTAPGWALVDVTDAGESVYAIRYRLRVFVFVRDETFRATDLTRKRTVLGLREVLLERLTVDEATAFVDVLTVEESYSDVAVDDDAGATVAAAYTELDLVVTEAINAPPPLGVVTLTDVDTANLPPHPAL